MFTGYEDALKYSLQALAQPAEYQRRLLHVWFEDLSEMPERLVQAHRHLTKRVKPSFTDRQQAALVDIFMKFESFSGPVHATHWRESALVESSHWEDVRQLAKKCLTAFGWQDDSPPLEIDAYGEDFFETDAFIPLCHVCGKPMQLIGLRAKAAKLGIRLPNDDEQFVIQCCGNTLTIDDPELAEAALRNLKKHHGITD